MRFLLVIASAILVQSSLNGQELFCTVKVNFDQITGTETRIYQTLESSIYTFMNNQRWTTDQYKTEERIDCSIFITINKKSSNTSFEGSIQVIAKRPIFNSSYSSTILNHKDDDFNFTYIEYDPLEFNMNSHLANLTSVLAFYAYLIIGIDYDSYELKGGSKYLDNAMKIVNNAQVSNDKGWKSVESDRNRYWMAQSLNDGFNTPLRECYYNYHIKGLDQMWKSVDEGRKATTAALNGLNKIHVVRPSSFIMKVFFNAKFDEIINIYSAANPEEKRQIAELCRLLDPGNSNNYNKISAGR